MYLEFHISSKTFANIVYCCLIYINLWLYQFSLVSTFILALIESNDS